MLESLVDLLLVRLGRDEEKRKVLKLLITNLDLSVTEAESAVANSPSVIKEAVPMSEARIIQKDLYPYIDLLPRLDDESEPLDNIDNKNDSETIDQDDFVDDSEDLDEIDDFPEDDQDFEEETAETDINAEVKDELEDATSSITPTKVKHSSKKTEENIEDNRKEDSEIDDESILLTSASDDIVSASRCHICGRRPAVGEKLAPCKACGEYTCRNCFDRIAHVCQKCASEGKTVNKATSIYSKGEENLEFDNEEVEEISQFSGMKVFRIVAIVLLFLAVGYAFYYFDPLQLFQVTTSQNETIADVIVDTVEVVQDSLSLNGDTSQTLLTDSIDGIEIVADSSLITSDSLAFYNTDSLGESDPYQIFSLELPNKYSVLENSMLTYETRTPASVSADVLLDESEVLFGHIGNIAASIPVEIDDSVLLLYEDSVTIVAFSILHSENMDRRIAFVREVSTFLSESKINQLVLVFQENTYYEPVHYGVSEEMFLELDGVFSPSQFQSLLGYYDGCQEFITESLVQWLSIKE